MQRLAITATFLAALCTATASAGWYGFNNTNACDGCGHGSGFAHQLHTMPPEQLWAGYCQEKAAARHGCGHGRGCGPACGMGGCGMGGCGTGGCGGAACDRGPVFGAGGCHRGELPGPSSCGADASDCTSGCTGSDPYPTAAGEAAVADYGDAEYENAEESEFDAVQAAE